MLPDTVSLKEVYVLAFHSQLTVNGIRGVNQPLPHCFYAIVMFGLHQARTEAGDMRPVKFHIIPELLQ